MEDKRTSFGVPTEDPNWMKMSKLFNNPPIQYNQIKEENKENLGVVDENIIKNITKELKNANMLSNNESKFFLLIIYNDI